MERMFVDTSAWFAYSNRKDADHAAVGKVFRKFEGRMVTSNYIFDETISLCLFRLGHAAARKIGAALLDVGAVDLIGVMPEDEQVAWTLFCNRPDQGYSFTDCTSFVLMRRLRISTALTVDDDFRREGFQVMP